MATFELWPLGDDPVLYQCVGDGLLCRFRQAILWPSLG